MNGPARIGKIDDLGSFGLYTSIRALKAAKFITLSFGKLFTKLSSKDVQIPFPFIITSLAHILQFDGFSSWNITARLCYYTDFSNTLDNQSEACTLLAQECDVMHAGFAKQATLLSVWHGLLTGITSQTHWGNLSVEVKELIEVLREIGLALNDAAMADTLVDVDVGKVEKMTRANQKLFKTVSHKFFDLSLKLHVQEPVLLLMIAALKKTKNIEGIDVDSLFDS